MVRIHDTGGVRLLAYMGSDGDDWGSLYGNDSQQVGLLDEGGSWAYPEYQTTVNSRMVNKRFDQNGGLWYIDFGL